MKILITFIIIAFISGCTPSAHLNLKTSKAKPSVKAKVSKAKLPTRKIRRKPQKSAAATSAGLRKQLLQMIQRDTAELSRLRRGSRVFSGPQRSFGASFARNMISGMSGNPFAAREKAVMRNLRANLDILNALDRRSAKPRHNCDDLSKLQAIELYLEGHRYLDWDGDGKPCEYIRDKYQY